MIGGRGEAKYGAGRESKGTAVRALGVGKLVELSSDGGSVFLTFRQDLPAVFIALYTLPRLRLGAVQLLEQRLAVVDVGGSEFFLAGDAVGGGSEGEGGGVAEEGEKEEEGEGEVHWVLWEGGMGAWTTRAMAKIMSLFEKRELGYRELSPNGSHRN